MSTTATRPSVNVIFAPIDTIIPNQFQQDEFVDQDKVIEIAESLVLHRDNGTHGLLQVPIARQVNGVYEEAFGRHRLLAFQYRVRQGDMFFQQMPLILQDLSDRQMFAYMGIENIKRREISIIEEGRIFQDYMTKFNANSVEAGDAFGKKNEYVRGAIRYLRLPEAAQQKLATGAITQTTARTLLSLQKVAPEEAIAVTLARLEKGVGKHGYKETPDEIIDGVLDDLEEVKLLWSGSRESKPRAGAGDAWLLDMKNFPNRFLPVLTPVDAAIALGIQDDQEMMEKVSTWIQASLGKLPELDMETLGIPEHLLNKLNHLINPPACSACPFYCVVQGAHYCGMEMCFNRKTRAWEYEKLRAASKDLKIEIYDPETDGEFRVLEETWSDNGKKHVELFRKRSKDLRLALAVDIDRKKHQSGYQGVPSGSVVMLVGKSLKTIVETGQQERAAKRSKEQAAALLARLLEEKREALDWELAGHVKILFDGINLTALHALWETPGRYNNEWATSFYNMPAARKPQKDAKDSDKADSYRLLMAFNMVRKIGGHYNKSISQYAVHAGDVVKSWGVKLPKSIMKLAAQMDEEIKAETEETEEA